MPKQWWQGNQGAENMGYGTFEPRPAAPILDELIASDDEPQVSNDDAIVQQDQQRYAS